MHFGIIETESLENKKILGDFNILKSYEESHPEDEVKAWTINKISLEWEGTLNLIKKLSKSMNGGWYSLIWNDEFVWVIFRDKFFKIKNENPWNKKEFNEVVDYGLSQGIKKIYFDNLRNSINYF